MSITDGFELISNHAYGKGGVPHELWTRLRAEAPVTHCHTRNYEPFWAVTKHDDICEISKQPLIFSSEPGIGIVHEKQKEIIDSGVTAFSSMRQIINMDPPEHRQYRKVAAPTFTPLAVKALDDAINTSAREIIDQLERDAAEGECDFATDVGVAHPLRILSTMLGLTAEQEPEILRLTNELFGADDPDLKREGDDSTETLMAMGMEFYGIFDEIIQDRRANPTDDLASVLANATIDGEPMGMMETIGYYLITFTAGHDTTKNALVGGMKAMIENPEQFEKLRRHPELVDAAVEEIARWTTPVNYMKRTATQDYELRGQRIKEGDALVMFYASANRDEDVFEDPFEFRIDRSPNRHLGFGFAEHFCLGANLARRSQRALWLELAARLDVIEFAGEPEQIHSSFVVGQKKLPIHYRFASAT